jgi:hypothetical protein
MKRRIVAGAAAAAAVFGVLAAAPVAATAGAADAAGAPLVTLAGSAHWLIFTHSTYDAIQARAESGAVRTLPTTPAGRSKDAGWSIATNVLTAGRPYPSRKVDWWNLRSKTHGTIVLGKRATYIASAPGGFFFISAHGNLVRRSITSHRRTSIGKGPAKNLVTGVAGPKGLLLDKSLSDKYFTYAKPKRVVKLRVPQNGGEPADCSAVDAVDTSYAACYRFRDGDDDRTPLADVLAPLDGGAPTISMVCPGVPAVTGRTMLWATGPHAASTETTCDQQPSTLDSITAGATTTQTSTTAVTEQRDDVGRALASSAGSYGKTVFVSADGQSFIAATTATHTQPL